MRRHCTTTCVLRHAEHARDDLLRLGRVLRRRVHEHARRPRRDQRERGLRLEIEVLLPADDELALEACAARRAARPRRRRVARRSPVGEEAAGGDGLRDRQDGRQRLVVDLAPAPAATRACSSRLGDHPGDGAGRGSRPRRETAARRGVAAPMSFSPGTSAAVSTASTPGAATRGGGVDAQDAGVRVRRPAPARRARRARWPATGRRRSVAAPVTWPDRRLVRHRRADLARHAGTAARAGCSRAVSAKNFSSSRPIIARR